MARDILNEIGKYQIELPVLSKESTEIDKDTLLTCGIGSMGWGRTVNPQVSGGQVMALFFLPVGRIAYSVDPEARQPVCV